MIRSAFKEDIADIKQIWSVCFAEDERYNEFFFKYEYEHNNTLVYIKDNKIVATLQRLPYLLEGVGYEPIKLTYIYGTATLPEFRRQGIMAEMIEKSCELDKANGIEGTMLIPANKNLFNYYKKLGFEDAFYISKDQYNFVENCIPIREATKDDIPEMLRFYSSLKMPHVQRRANYFRNQIIMFNDLGGNVYICDHGYAFVTDDDELTCAEMVLDDPAYESSFCCAIMKERNRLMMRLAKPGPDRPLGVMRWHKEHKPQKMYMNLMFN